MAFADSGRPDQKHVALLGDEVAGSQLVDAPAGDGRVEAEVEVLQRAAFAEARRLMPAGDLPLLANVQFVLEDEYVLQPCHFFTTSTPCSKSAVRAVWRR